MENDYQLLLNYIHELYAKLNEIEQTVRIMEMKESIQRDYLKEIFGGEK